MPTFQELAAEYLQGFGFAVTAEEIEAQDVVTQVNNGIAQWQNSVDDRTWSIIVYAGGEIADGLWHNGFFEGWPKMYELVKSNVSGTWRDTLLNINTCLQHAAQNAGAESDAAEPEGNGAEGSESEGEQQNQ